MRTVSQAGGVTGSGVSVPARLRGAGCALTAELTQPISPPQDTPESTACLRATTILQVLQVLDNLRCAALQDKC